MFPLFEYILFMIEKNNVSNLYDRLFIFCRILQATYKFRQIFQQKIDTITKGSFYEEKRNKNNKLNSSENTKTAPVAPPTIEATEIKINENIKKLDVGENKILTATIIPENTTNKSITWKSSDESIASISTTGELIAKKQGTVDITATSSNGKESTLKIIIEEKPVVTNNTMIKTSAIIKNDNNTIDSNDNNQENSNAVVGILTLGLLGGGGVWLYKKHKK